MSSNDWHIVGTYASSSLASSPGEAQHNPAMPTVEARVCHRINAAPQMPNIPDIWDDRHTTMFREVHQRSTVYLSGSWDVEHTDVNLLIASRLAEQGLVVIGDHPSRPAERGLNYAARVDEHMQNCSGIVLVFPLREGYRQSTSSPMFVELLLAAKYRLPMLLLLEEGVLLRVQDGDGESRLSFGQNPDFGGSLRFRDFEQGLGADHLNHLNTSRFFEASTVVIPAPAFLDYSIRVPRVPDRFDAAAPLLHFAIESFVQALVNPARPQYIFQIAPYDRGKERMVVADAIFRVTGLRSVNASDAWAGAPFANEKEIISRITKALFVVADLSGHRPACVFEVGCSIGAERPTAIFRQKTSEKLPFGLEKSRLIEFESEHDLQARIMEFCKPFRRRVFNLEMKEQTVSVGSAAGRRDPNPSEQSKPIQMNQYNFFAPVSGSGFADGGTVIINDPAALNAILIAIKNHHQELPLSADEGQELKRAVADLEKAVVEKRPDATVLREGLASIRHILEHAAGAMIGHAAPEWLPVVSHQIQALLSVLVK